MTEEQNDEKQRLENQKHDHNMEMEQSFLGSLIIITTYNKDMPLLQIKADCFFSESNRLIFRTIFKQIKDGLKPDIQTLASDPNLTGIEKNYISSLHDKIPSAENILYYESEIIKAWQTRTAEHAAHKFITKIKSAEYTGEIEPLIRDFMEIMTGAVSDTQYNRLSTWAEYFNTCTVYDPSKDFKPSMLAGLRFPNGTLSYIGARPGGGKSTILINIAREALTAERKVFLVNMEMINKTIITNFALSLIYASANKNQRQELESIKSPQNLYYSLFKREYDSRQTFDNLRYNAIEKIKLLLNTSLFVFNGAGGKLDSILMAIESKVNEGDIILIDYIQRMPPPKENNDQRYIQIKNTSNALLTLAMKKNVVIISGAQFGRQTKDNKTGEATLDDFRESGDIEQDAHNAMAIENIDEKSRYIHVLKQREGGAEFIRAELDCNFNYLYIAGTGSKYVPTKEKEKITPKKSKWQGERQTAQEATAAGKSLL
jgi:replicative DNA helicase